MAPGYRAARALAHAISVLVDDDGAAHAAAMIELYAPRERDALRRAGRVAAATLDVVGRALRPGMSTADINDLVANDTRARGGRPSQLGYQGFPAVVCTSVNDVVCHGVPSAREVLRAGDIVNVDVTTEFDGFHGDCSATFAVGAVSDDAAFVVDVARRARDAGIAAVAAGARLGDIGAAIVDVAAAAGCSVVEGFGGHGIGRRMHMDPHVSHVGKRGKGLKLVPGMCFTIEPMINRGGKDVVVAADGWRVVTADGSLSAQFEHTVLLTEDGVEILTLAP
jgi:methionyl aminopeptidase